MANMHNIRRGIGTPNWNVSIINISYYTCASLPWHVKMFICPSCSSYAGSWGQSQLTLEAWCTLDRSPGAVKWQCEALHHHVKMSASAETRDFMKQLEGKLPLIVHTCSCDVRLEADSQTCLLTLNYSNKVSSLSKMDRIVFKFIDLMDVVVKPLGRLEFYTGLFILSAWFWWKKQTPVTLSKYHESMHSGSLQLATKV